MSYKRQPTEELTPPDPVVAHTARVAACVAACEGVDNDTLVLLARKYKSGQTVMQDMLSRVTWHSLPALK